MTLEADIRILSGVKLFHDFTNEELRLLAFGAETVRLSAGRVLYREGHIADSAYVVAQGAISIFRERGEERVLLGEAGPGAMLGELALIARSTRPSSALAATPATLLRLNRTLFRRILEEYPETAALLHARISAEFAEMLRRIGEVAPRFSD